MTEALYPASSTEPSTNQPSTTDVAKDEAANVGHAATDAGQQVASVAKDQAQNVAAEAGAQAKDLMNQARSELTDQAGQQQQRLAGGLRALGDELESMTHHSAESGVATDLARQASQRSHDAAQWLESREPGNLVTELKDFARQRPVAFLALAAGAGLLAGRLTRGITADSADDGPAAQSPSAQAVAPVPQTPVRPFATSQDSSLGTEALGQYR